MERKPHEGLIESNWKKIYWRVIEEQANPLTAYTTYNDEYVPANAVSPSYSTGYGGNTSPALNSSPSVRRRQDVIRTPGLVQEPGSSQTGTPPNLPTPSDKLLIATDFSYPRSHVATTISPAIERLSLGGGSELLAYHNGVGLSQSKEQTGQEQFPPALFYNGNDEGDKLDLIDSDLHSLTQFPEGNDGGSGPEPAQFVLSPDFLPVGGEPGSAFAQPRYGSNIAYSTAPGSTSQGHHCPTSFIPPIPDPPHSSWVFDPFNDVCPPEYYSHIQKLRSGNFDNSPVSIREPQSSSSIRPTATFETHGGEPARSRRSSTAPSRRPGSVSSSPTSLRQPLSPSGIVPTTFDKRGGKGSAPHLPTFEEGIVRMEGASLAHRLAADKFRKRERKHECKVCGDTLTSLQNLKNHMNSHLQIKPYQCVYCSNSYRHGRSLNRHIKKSHEFPDKK